MRPLGDFITEVFAASVARVRHDPRVNPPAINGTVIYKRTGYYRIRKSSEITVKYLFFDSHGTRHRSY